MYVDDLDALIEVLGKSIDQVELEGDDFTGEKPADLIGLGDRPIPKLSLVASHQEQGPGDYTYPRPLLSINFDSGYGASVYAYPKPGDPEHLTARGLVDVAEQFLKEHRTKGRALAVRLLGSLGSPYIVAATVGAIVGLVTGSVKWGYIVGLACVLPALALGYWLSFGLSKALVLPQYRKDAPSFWRRNRDTIVVSIITTVISAGLGYLLGRAS